MNTVKKNREFSNPSNKFSILTINKRLMITLKIVIIVIIGLSVINNNSMASSQSYIHYVIGSSINKTSPNKVSRNVINKKTSKSRLTIDIKQNNSTSKVIQNSEIIQPCQSEDKNCNSSQLNLSFPNYGNDLVTGLLDCTFAAVADWEQIVLGITPDEKQIESEFKKMNPNNNGLSNEQLFSYWKNNGIGQIYLKAATPIGKDSDSIENAINNSKTKALIAQVIFQAGETFYDVKFQNSNYHWMVIDGYNTTGPLVVTWGRTIQMTWQQWNTDANAVWKISASI